MELLRTILPYAQIVLSIVLVALILVQQNESSAGAAFGGSSGGASFHVKRGAEKTLFIATIIVSILFVASAIIALVL